MRDDKPADLDLTIAQEAARMVRGGSGLVEEADLVNTAHVWLLEDERRLKAFWYFDDEGVERFSYMNLRRKLRVAMKAEIDAARRALNIGEPDGRYGAREIENLLPYVWHSEVLAAVAQEASGRGAKVDPALSGDSMAKGVDIRSVYRDVVDEGSENDRIMFSYFGLGLYEQEIADKLGIDRTTVNRRKAAVVRHIADRLNGELSEWPEGPGTREVRSNLESLRSVSGL